MLIKNYENISTKWILTEDGYKNKTEILVNIWSHTA